MGTKSQLKEKKKAKPQRETLDQVPKQSDGKRITT
jgi:hypothetical protein